MSTTSPGSSVIIRETRVTDWTLSRMRSRVVDDCVLRPSIRVQIARSLSSNPHTSSGPIGQKPSRLFERARCQSRPCTLIAVKSLAIVTPKIAARAASSSAHFTRLPTTTASSTSIHLGVSRDDDKLRGIRDRIGSLQKHDRLKAAVGVVRFSRAYARSNILEQAAIVVSKRHDLRRRDRRMKRDVGTGDRVQVHSLPKPWSSRQARDVSAIASSPLRGTTANAEPNEASFAHAYGVLVSVKPAPRRKCSTSGNYHS